MGGAEVYHVLVAADDVVGYDDVCTVMDYVLRDYVLRERGDDVDLLWVAMFDIADRNEDWDGVVPFDTAGLPVRDRILDADSAFECRGYIYDPGWAQER